MSTSALIQVFGNTTLLHQVTAFTPGVPYFVIQFKEPEYTNHVNQTTVLDEWSKQVDLTLWKVTILCNKRVISALNDLSEIPAYEFNRHVQLTQVVMFALTHTQDLVLLDWLEENLFKQHQQCIRYQLRKDITQLGSSAILIVWWLAVKRNYASTTEWMEAAARRGNLELVCYFLETETMPTCTPTTLSYAAGSGNLELVRYLHEDITEGWTTGVMDLAAVNRHLEIVKFLYENQTDGCSVTALFEAEGQQQLVESLSKTLETTERFYYLTVYQPVNDYKGFYRRRFAHRSSPIRREQATYLQDARIALLNESVAAQTSPLISYLFDTGSCARPTQFTYKLSRQFCILFARLNAISEHLPKQ